jgi:flagellar biosynthesis/type III secretory pathway M-ring protein FliF/YscJ
VAPFVQRWNALSLKARAGAAVLGFAALAALGLAIVLGRDTRVPLFAAPLRSDQITEVVNRLAEWNAGFIVGSDNVRVDADRRNGLLLKLALAGVPHAHLDSSAEALAKAGPLTPQSVLDAQALDGIAGDLAAALRTLSGVEDAQVIVAPARDGAFAGEAEHAASASVRLTLAPGASIAPQQLAGVRQFVAAGVPDLDPRRVAILDDRGLALSDESSAASGDAPAFQQSLQSALDLALGADAAIVRVRVSYDPRLRQLHEVTRKPAGSRPIGTTTIDERYKSASKQYAKTTAGTDRGSIVSDERVDTPAGRLERISVAVVVDANRHFDLAKIRSLAEATLGIVAARGDVVSVEELAFAREPPPAPPASFEAMLGLAAALAPNAVFACVLLAAARVGARPVAIACEALASRVAVRRGARDVATFPPAQVRGALKDEPPHTAAAIISALPAATAAAVLDLYPAEERAAIVRRMSRSAAPVVPDYETIVRRA